jgi:AhpD family alkylhydroperoxidase
MGQLTVVDRPLCCSSGVCGPDPDPELARFADDLRWLEDQGVAVVRINPSADPEAFLALPALMPVFESRGNACLPAVLADGEIVSTGSYPDREELARLAGATSGRSQGLDPRTRELVAIGASIAANCEPCFRFHYAEARKLGVTNDAMAAAVEGAQMVKNSPAHAMLALADKYLRRDSSASTPAGCSCGAGVAPAACASDLGASAPSGCCC